MADGYGFTETDCKIILNQIERRAKYRKEYLKLKTDPSKHAAEAGYVFDPAIQRFLSMKIYQVDHFTACYRTIRFGILTIILPMFSLGYAVWTQRQKFENDCRTGRLRYRDRLFKLA